MTSGAEQNESQNRAAPGAAGRNDPAGANGTAPGGQVGPNWIGRFGVLALLVERNRKRWRNLAEDYLAALKELQASVQELKKNVYGILRYELEQKLLNLELRITEIVQGKSYERAVQEAEEIRKRLMDEVGRLRRGKA